MSLGDRLRASARRARVGRGGGLAGPLLARLGVDGPRPHGAEAQQRAERETRSDPWQEQPADAYDDAELAALRDELNTELDRLSRPQNDEAPGP
jgi:hypothetical protein